MSRVAKQPITIPSNVEVKVDGANVAVKGPKGSLQRSVYKGVVIKNANNQLEVTVENDDLWQFAGTERSLINSMVIGVNDGFEKKLELVGVGYRARMKGNVLNLNLGFSHDINFPVPEGLTIQTPTQTEVIISGIDKQQVGQAAAEIRSFRPPEPYKGKGVRYANEYIRRKEVKKK